jgi:hypothetical protein
MKYAIIAILALSGCSLIPPQAAEKIVTGVKTYCAQPIEQRLLLRSSVNTGLAGEAEIKVVCKGDPES